MSPILGQNSNNNFNNNVNLFALILKRMESHLCDSLHKKSKDYVAKRTRFENKKYII